MKENIKRGIIQQYIDTERLLLKEATKYMTTYQAEQEEIAMEKRIEQFKLLLQSYSNCLENDCNIMSERKQVGAIDDWEW